MRGIRDSVESLNCGTVEPVPVSSAELHSISIVRDRRGPGRFARSADSFVREFLGHGLLRADKAVRAPRICNPQAVRGTKAPDNTNALPNATPLRACSRFIGVRRYGRLQICVTVNWQSLPLRLTHFCAFALITGSGQRNVAFLGQSGINSRHASVGARNQSGG